MAIREGRAAKRTREEVKETRPSVEAALFRFVSIRGSTAKIRKKLEKLYKEVGKEKRG
jgi:hypothetical protein